MHSYCGVMKTGMTTLVTLVLAAILTAGTTLPAQSACLGAAAVAAAKNSGQILSSPQLYARIGVGPGTGQVVLSEKVCENGGRLYYQLTIDTKTAIGGIVMRFDATNGRPLG